MIISSSEWEIREFLKAKLHCKKGVSKKQKGIKKKSNYLSMKLMMVILSRNFKKLQETYNFLKHLFILDLRYLFLLVSTF